MKASRPKNAAMWCAALLSLLIGIGVPANWVLCFGADGHVAVESYTAAGCGPISGAASATIHSSHKAFDVHTIMTVPAKTYRLP